MRYSIGPPLWILLQQIIALDRMDKNLNVESV